MEVGLKHKHKAAFLGGIDESNDIVARVHLKKQTLIYLLEKMQSKTIASQHLKKQSNDINAKAKPSANRCIIFILMSFFIFVRPRSVRTSATCNYCQSVLVRFEVMLDA